MHQCRSKQSRAADIPGDMSFTNIQGEAVKKLDAFANDQLITVLKNGMSCAGVCSKEEDNMIVFNDELSNNSKYLVLFYPPDGSSENNYTLRYAGSLVADLHCNLIEGSHFPVFHRRNTHLLFK